MDADVDLPHAPLDELSVQHAAPNETYASPVERALEIVGHPGAQVIEHQDAISAGGKAIGQMRADEPGSARDQIDARHRLNTWLVLR
jgi:hypothetical protein